ncbi:MAG: exosortase, partial [Verrucomicrobia bacterium]|nr:exosortase [Verrucomicrobiota bacterium]
MVTRVQTAAINPPDVCRPLNRCWLKQFLLAGCVFGLLWSLLVVHLAQIWAFDPQYSFGWFSPILGGYLFFIRWQNRPAPRPKRSAPALCILVFCAFLLLPTWFIIQPNADWHLLTLLLASEVITITLCALYFAGGRSWIRHFAFSVCFILAAVPWFTLMEAAVIQTLQRWVTTLTIALLRLCHVPALAYGNIIQLPSGSLEVDGACSGFQSLQATLMITLFLGALYQASIHRRALLLTFGVALAFAGNVIRALTLSLIAYSQGIENIEFWHDPTGYAILALCFLLVWYFARLLCDPLPQIEFHHNQTNAFFPKRVIIHLGVWVMLVVVACEAWYRSHSSVQRERWAVKFPVSANEYSQIAFSPQELALLAFDSGQGAEWADSGDHQWTGFFFRWEKGPTRSRLLARLHRPEVCLPASGYELVESRGELTVPAGHIKMRFDATLFRSGDEMLYVYYCLWEDQAYGSAQSLSPTTFGRV